MSRSLDTSTAQHARRLQELVRERIRAAGGWLPFSQFMELALYAPGLGYYSAGSVKLGAAGDFVTAPEVSDLFSACVARQCAEVLAGTGGDILEFGAGTGRLAAVVLRELDAAGVGPQRYRILEVSADLRERQRAALAALPGALRDRVEWLDRLPATPIRGVMLANEVLDALPFERIVVRDGGVRALGVALDESGAFVSSEREADAALESRSMRLVASLPHALPQGYVTELSPRTAAWIASAADCLEQGVALLFDYGLPAAHLYHPQRTQGTLRCHFRHVAHDDPFANVGLQDITAWVDFSAVAQAAVTARLDVLGFTTQTAFLLGTGIESMLADGEADLRKRVERSAEAQRLLLPGQMGEAFKAMALGRGYDRALSGFSLRDFRDSL
jgi:SAM-dependent MidA family methyltransferase